MNKQNKWKMNRAGLLNFWYYDDEVFEFADGKLLLRGSNGSGKSVTMQSLLPVLLDGKTSSDRLDPFGSRARRMEDYLLGEKEIVNRDERTGYLFIEYKREDTNQYITTGIGLQARRHKTMNFWGFIITDNRRIGKDFNLYEHEYNAGEKQQIPLSRIQLENRIDRGGYVVRTRREYSDLVNKYIFGFESAEAYEDLIKLLIQLRSPKLSKDFRPTVIYEILEAALPPLTDEDLRHLSDTIEHMDQTKQQIEQLDREHEALKKLISRYHNYNEYRLAETAHHYLEMNKRFKKEEATIQEKKLAEESLNQEINELSARNRELDQDLEVLHIKEKRLANHEVWDLEKDRTNEQTSLEEIQHESKKKDKNLNEKKRQELTIKDEQDHLIAAIDSNESALDNILIDMENDAEATSFKQHALNVQDFERHKNEDYDFTVWEKETDHHYQKLNTISEQLREFEQKKERMTELDHKIAATRLEIDQMKQEKQDWLKIFEEDKQAKLAEIHRWTERYPFFVVSDELIQQTSRKMSNLYDSITYENIRTPFVIVNNDFQMGKNEKIATKRSYTTELEKQIGEKQALLKEWQEKKDPEPPNQQDETKAARKQLRQAGHSFISFYEAVEFQDHVPEEVQNKIEAALLDTGLLDALITSEQTPIKHDRVIHPKPNMMAHTLADYLVSDVELTAEVSGIDVDEVLRSILVDGEADESVVMIQEDGAYQIGLLHGHAVPVERVRFIGRNARKRYREEQIAIITSEMEELMNIKEQVQLEIKALEDNIQTAQKAMEVFPMDEDLQISFNEIKAMELQIKQIEKLLIEYDLDMQQTHKVFQQIKRGLDAETREINIEFSIAAYQEAKISIRRYEKDLSNVKATYITYRNNQNNLAQSKIRLNELILEVDDLNGELNVLKDKAERITKNIIAIEQQLDTQGVKDVRKQIQEVQLQLKQTTAELDENRNVLPEKKALVKTLNGEIVDNQQKSRFWEHMIEAWLTSFSQEVNYNFVERPEEITTKEALAKSVIKIYGDRLNKQDSARIEGQLTSVYYEQLTNLMEYRMTDNPTPVIEFPWMNEEWSDEQKIMLINWKDKAGRRLIELEFQGKWVSPYYIQEVVENDRMSQETMLNDQDRQLYEEILFHSIGRKLRSRINRAQRWTEEMNKLMEDSDSSSGLSFSIRWKPRTAETEAELDTKELIDLLRRDPGLLKEEDLNQVIGHFRSKIDRAKELIQMKGEGDTLLQVLKEVLDYRYWFSFVLSYQREGEPKRELTNNAFHRFSGGEKAMAMYIPLFTACYSRYLEADQSAPYIISLDEAFAGVDEDNISVMFRIVEELGFDYIMNSQVLWGDYDTVSSLSVCELVRPKNASYVTVIRYYWDGNSRRLLVDENITDENQMVTSR
ncbi:MAG TPA: TIGR02680 family protein [Virgibacillus sp.]|nr:TIGR02680 family protein [Virgibacillus sp.]